jgi:hypothetical protein
MKLLAISEIEEAIQQTTQTTTQISNDATQITTPVENLNSASISQNMNVHSCGCGLDWSRIEAFQASNPGSNPGSRTTLELNKYFFLSPSFF